MICSRVLILPGLALAGSFAAATVSRTSGRDEAALNLLFNGGGPNFSLTGSQEVTGDPSLSRWLEFIPSNFTTGTARSSSPNRRIRITVIYLLDNSKDGSIQHL